MNTISKIHQALDYYTDGLINYVELIQSVVNITTDEHTKLGQQACDTLRTLGYYEEDSPFHLFPKK